MSTKLKATWKYRLWLFLFIAVAMFFVGSPEAAASNYTAGLRPGLFVYGEGVVQNPHYRVWSDQVWSAEANMSSIGGTIEWVRISASTKRNEYITVFADATNHLNAEIYSKKLGYFCWHNGTTCDGSFEFTAASHNVNQQKIDVAHEQLSGDAIVVFSDNTLLPKFRIWDGDSWSQQYDINDTTVSNIGTLTLSGVKETIQLVSRPNSNEIALILSDDQDDSEIIIWNGTHWNCESARLSGSIGATDFKKVEGAYEQVSGDLFVVSAVSTTSINYTTKAAGACAFTTTLLAATDSQDIDIASQPGSDYIMMAGHIGGATDDIYARPWNGTAWRTASGEDSIIHASEVSPNRLISAAWAGRANSTVIYADSAGTSLDWFVYNKATNVWNIVPADFAPTPAFQNIENNIISYSFLDENKTFAFLKDDGAYLWAKIFNSTSNSWFDTEGGAALETSSSVTDFPSFQFVWKLFEGIEWNISAINVSAARGFNTTYDVLVMPSGVNDAVQIYNISGNGSAFMNITPRSLGSITADVSVEINCSPSYTQPQGYYETLFKVNSTQHTTGDNITMGCDVINIPPTQGTPIINSTYGTNGTLENLTCYNQSTNDLNRDTSKNIYSWFVNETEIVLLNMPFEGGSNSTYTKDYTAYVNDGTAIGANWSGSAGYDGKGAYYFNGINDYINVTDSPSVSLGDRLSITAWVYDRGGTGTKTIASKNNEYLFRIDPTGEAGLLSCFINLGGSWETRISTTTPIAQNVWHHVVCAWNNATGTLSIYLNGTLNNSRSDRQGAITATAEPVQIGSWTGGNFWNGTIDEVMIWNRTLSAAQVRQLYSDGAKTIVSAELTHKDRWNCSITPNDGYDDGLMASSANVTVDGCVPPRYDNWILDCGYVCNWLQNINVPRNVTLQGSGALLLNATMNFTSSSQFIFQHSGCEFRIGKSGQMTG